MRPHERLNVWKKAVDFVVEIYQGAEQFPKDERFGLTSQLRRTAISIPANIAEGAGRNSSKEFAYFLSNAQGSASELQTEIFIAYRLNYLRREDYDRLQTAIDDVSRMIIGLQRSIRQRITLRSN